MAFNQVVLDCVGSYLYNSVRMILVDGLSGVVYSVVRDLVMLFSGTGNTVPHYFTG